MVRQARSEATRRKILDAAVDLFGEVGYPATGLGDITERANLTKGALYYHFDSKEALATAIIEEGGATLHRSYLSIAESSSPALESVIHGVFVVADIVSTDKFARTAAQLVHTFGEFNEAAARTYGLWLETMRAQTERATVEGDLRADLDPDTVGRAIVAAIVGTHLISNATTGGADLLRQVGQTWEILLPAIASKESLPYFREFLAREAMRHPVTPPRE